MMQVSIIKNVKFVTQAAAPFVWVYGGRVMPSLGTLITDLGEGRFSARTFADWGRPKETILELVDSTLRVATN